MDENKIPRESAAGVRSAADSQSKHSDGKKRPDRRSRFKRNRGRGGKQSDAETKSAARAENGNSELQSGTAKKRHGKHAKHNNRQAEYSHAEDISNGENRTDKQQAKKSPNGDRRPNGAAEEKRPKIGANGQKQDEKHNGAKHNDRSRRPSDNRSGEGTDSPAHEPINVIDNDVSVYLPDYLLSPYTAEPKPDPEPEPAFEPGTYRFPDDTGHIVFGDAPEEKPKVEEPADPIEQVEIVDVRFKLSGKTYFFSPNGLTLAKDDNVIVETARGLEFGTVVQPNRTVPVTDIVPPLKNVLRIATEEDKQRRAANEEKEIEAFNICLQKIEAHGLEMKLVDVEYTFDNSKLLFYFSADGRVDFRELARDLASVFRTRIELRQIGIRDEAKMMGGLGICGRPLCCSTFLSDFGQVSIKMAKEQNLSLNSAKISGTCGRLMCCLRYEYGTYAEELAKTPRVDTLVETPDGPGIVTETSPLAGLVKVRLQKNPDQPPRYYNRADLKQIAAPQPAQIDVKSDYAVLDDEDEAFAANGDIAETLSGITPDAAGNNSGDTDDE
jgi:cell fate regulator YaaT (PSP1 superfamily)